MADKIKIQKKGSVQVTPEAYDRVVEIADHYGMTQRGAAALMLMAVSNEEIKRAVSAVNLRLSVVVAAGLPDAPEVPKIGDE